MKTARFLKIHSFGLLRKISLKLHFSLSDSRKGPPLSSLLQELSELKPVMAEKKETLAQKYVSILLVVTLYW
jgi:hypothetical protein